MHFGVVCEGSLMGHGQGGIEKLVNLCRVRLIFPGELAEFSQTEEKVRTFEIKCIRKICSKD